MLQTAEFLFDGGVFPADFLKPFFGNEADLISLFAESLVGVVLPVQQAVLTA